MFNLHPAGSFKKKISHLHHDEEGDGKTTSQRGHQNHKQNQKCGTPLLQLQLFHTSRLSEMSESSSLQGLREMHTADLSWRRTKKYVGYFENYIYNTLFSWCKFISRCFKLVKTYTWQYGSTMVNVHFAPWDAKCWWWWNARPKVETSWRSSTQR